MATLGIAIGGEWVPLPPLANFAALKRAWPAIEALGSAQAPIDRIDAAVALVAAALAPSRPELTVDELSERLRSGELPPLLRIVPDLLTASGLVPSGEALPAGTGSTAISIA